MRISLFVAWLGLLVGCLPVRHDRRFKKETLQEATVDYERFLSPHDPRRNSWSERVNALSLSQLIESSSEPKVVCLLLLGGAQWDEVDYSSLESWWCGDTKQELPLYRSLFKAFRNQPVLFLPVLCPPVFRGQKSTSDWYPFWAAKTADPHFSEEVLHFIGASRTLWESEFPFEEPRAEPYYDLSFRLLWNRSKPTPPDRVLEPWEGAFKADGDAQTYGTPTIWILSRDGEVMCEPFWGNNYPDKIRYRYEDVATAIEEALRKIASRRSS